MICAKRTSREHTKVKIDSDLSRATGSPTRKKKRKEKQKKQKTNKSKQDKANNKSKETQNNQPTKYQQKQLQHKTKKKKQAKKKSKTNDIAQETDNVGQLHYILLNIATVLLFNNSLSIQRHCVQHHNQHSRFVAIVFSAGMIGIQNRTVVFHAQVAVGRDALLSQSSIGIIIFLCSVPSSSQETNEHNNTVFFGQITSPIHSWRLALVH